MSSVVIGGGLAGLSAALTLQEAGETVELFEESDAIGGRVRSDYLDGYILDRGFQLINAGYP
jgi:phytoene dehydrogenase-like protein